MLESHLATCFKSLGKHTFCCCSVDKSCLTLCNPENCKHARLRGPSLSPCPSPSPRVCSNSCPLSQWWDSAILSSVIPFSSCPQSFPASGSFPTSWLFSSVGQSIGASASASILPKNIQGWFTLGVAALISLQSKGFSRVFSSTTVWIHQFFGTQPFLWSNSHICNDYWKKKTHSFDNMDLC